MSRARRNQKFLRAKDFPEWVTIAMNEVGAFVCEGDAGPDFKVAFEGDGVYAAVDLRRLRQDLLLAVELFHVVDPQSDFAIARPVLVPRVVGHQRFLADKRDGGVGRVAVYSVVDVLNV